MADRQATGPSDSLPKFDNGKTYLLTGQSLNQIVSAIRANQVKVVTGGGLKIVKQTADGTFLAADPSSLLNSILGFSTMNLNVCVNGSPTSRIFVTKITQT